MGDKTKTGPSVALIRSLLTLMVPHPPRCPTDPHGGAAGVREGQPPRGADPSLPAALRCVFPPPVPPPPNKATPGDEDVVAADRWACAGMGWVREDGGCSSD